MAMYKLPIKILFSFLLTFIVFLSCGKKDAAAVNPTPVTPPVQNLTPTVTKIDPVSSPFGSTVTITGTNFTGATKVTFGDALSANFSVESATTIKAVVSSGTSDKVTVTTPKGDATISGFTTTYVAPTSGKLPATFTSGVALGFPRVADRGNPLGDINVVVVFVDFSDAAATKTPEQIFNDNLSPHAENFMAANSYGKANLKFIPNFKWFRMSKPSTGYNWNALTGLTHRDYIQEAMKLADSSTDFTKGDMVLVVANPEATAISNGPTLTGTTSFNVSGDGKVFKNAITSGRDLVLWKPGLWYCHELGHSLGLVDLYLYNPGTGLSNLKFIGQHSMMGNIAGASPEYLGFERWQLGWLEDKQVVSETTAGTNYLTITPIEKQGGIKLLVLPIGTNSAVVVESRRKQGYNVNIPKEGPLVYLVDTKVASGTGTVKILPINESDAVKTKNILSVSESITYGNITITYDSKSSDGDVIKFQRN